MAFNPTRAAEIDQSTVEAAEIQFPLIQWSYGDPKLAKSSTSAEAIGGFFLSETNIPPAIKADLIPELVARGWHKDTLTLRDGNDLVGCSTRELTLSVVNSRKRWKAGDSGSTVYYSWGWDQYKEAVAAHGRAVSQIHIYALLQELEVFGPFIITLSGSAALAFEGSRQMAGVLQGFSRTVIAAANAASKGARWPYRQFWLTFGADRDSHDKAKFSEMGTGDKKVRLVLPVALNLPADPKDVDLDDYYIGDENFAFINEMYEESVAWKKQWDSFSPGKAEIKAEDVANEDVDYYESAGM